MQAGELICGEREGNKELQCIDWTEYSPVVLWEQTEEIT